MILVNIVLSQTMSVNALRPQSAGTMRKDGMSLPHACAVVDFVCTCTVFQLFTLMKDLFIMEIDFAGTSSTMSR